MGLSNTAAVRFAGIDVGSQTHVLAIIGESGQILVKPTPFGEDAPGYEKLLEILGSPEDILVAMEATGHYGWNLFGTLTEKGFHVALLNPLRTRRFAEEDLRRAKTDSIDALGIARFAAQKQPPPTPHPDVATQGLRELVRFHHRLTQDFGDRIRQLHRLLDLGFPEFTRCVRTLDSQLATVILREYPTAAAFHACRLDELARLRHGPRNLVGLARARSLLDAASHSVGRHHDLVYQAEVQWICDDLDTLRHRIRQMRSDIEGRVSDHPVGALLLTIKPLGPHAAAHIIAAVGDPARFRHARAFAAYVGTVPGTNHSGLWRPGQAALSPIGNARLRRALWMSTLTAVHTDPWLTTFYKRLRARGKKPKVALIAAMRKLLTAVYSVAKNRRPFVERVDASTPEHRASAPEPT